MIVSLRSPAKQPSSVQLYFLGKRVKLQMTLQSQDERAVRQSDRVSRDLSYRYAVRDMRYAISTRAPTSEG